MMNIVRYVPCLGAVLDLVVTFIDNRQRIKIYF